MSYSERSTLLTWVPRIASLATALLTAYFVWPFIYQDDPRSAATVIGIIGFIAGSVGRRLSRRLLRSYLTGRPIRFRLQFRTREVVQATVTYLTIGFVGLVSFHAITTGSISAGFRMASTDVKVMARCPHKPGAVASFIARGPSESALVGVMSFIGHDVAAEVCRNRS